MPRRGFSLDWKKILFSTLPFAAVACGALAGWFGAMTALSVRLTRIEATLAERVSLPTKRPEIEIVPVETRPAAPAIPSAFVTRRQSPVLTLARRAAAAKSADDQPVATERELGAAVALSSDGWLVTTVAALSGVRAVDVQALWNGRSYPVQKAVRDIFTDAIFLKIAATDLPVTAFVRAGDVAAGSGVWLESRARRLFPETVVDTRFAPGTEIVSSERAARRFLVTGPNDPQAAGAALWDAGGQLIGLLETRTANGWRVLPAGDLINALTSLLAMGEIRHATLGVRASDLAGLAFENGRGKLPAQGAWLRADKKGGLPAVNPQGPAAKALHDGDVIERIEHDILDGSADLGERLLDYRPGTEITLVGSRQGAAFQFTLKLGDQLAGEPVK